MDQSFLKLPLHLEYAGQVRMGRSKLWYDLEEGPEREGGGVGWAVIAGVWQ